MSRCRIASGGICGDVVDGDGDGGVPKRTRTSPEGIHRVCSSDRPGSILYKSLVLSSSSPGNQRTLQIPRIHFHRNPLPGESARAGRE